MRKFLCSFGVVMFDNARYVAFEGRVMEVRRLGVIILSYISENLRSSSTLRSVKRHGNSAYRRLNPEKRPRRTKRLHCKDVFQEYAQNPWSHQTVRIVWATLPTSPKLLLMSLSFHSLLLLDSWSAWHICCAKSGPFLFPGPYIPSQDFHIFILFQLVSHGERCLFGVGLVKVIHQVRTAQHRWWLPRIIPITNPDNAV